MVILLRKLMELNLQRKIGGDLQSTEFFMNHGG